MNFFQRLLVALTNPSAVRDSSPDVRFHKEAAPYGRHGRIRVSNRAEGLDDRIVVFVFIGAHRAPPLTKAVIDHLWEEARAQGYIPYEVTEYSHILIAPEAEGSAGAPWDSTPAAPINVM